MIRAVSLVAGVLASAFAATGAGAQTQPPAQTRPAVTVGSLVAEGFVVRGISMPDHHAVNFIAQKDKTIFWCEGTNFGAVIVGKAPAIETRCYEVK